MADGTVLVQQASPGDRAIDNEVVLNDVGASVYRQKVNAANLSTANLDITLSALRDAITKTGATTKTLADVVAALQAALTVDTELPAAAALVDAEANPTVPGVGSHLMGWNTTTWDRVIAGSTAADAVATRTSGAVQARAHLMGYNGTTFDRLRTGSPTADPGATGVLAAQMHITDGTNILRLRSSSALADGGGASVPPAGNFLYNGSTWDRMRGTIANGVLVDVSRQPSSYRTDTYTTTANGVTVDVSASPVRDFAIQVKGTGATATTWDIRLEGSLDNVNFSQILQHTNTTGDGAVLWSGAARSPARYFRSRCAAVALGSATNVVVSVMGQA